ncbi:molybdopterin-dependent oxidoreductase [Chloroflexota bacterium]
MMASSLVASCNPSVTGREQSLTDLSYLKQSDPTEVDNSDLLVTQVEELHTTGSPPAIDIDEYRLVIDGLVATPLSLTYEELLRYATIAEKVLLICPGLFVDNAVWTGVPLETLLEEAGVHPDAFLIVFRGADGYSKNIPYDYLKEAKVFLAYEVNGQVLALEHGYPLRVVVEGKYGNIWVKWIARIEVM